MGRLFGVVDVERRAVAVAAYVGAVGAGVLARLLYGTLYAESLHVLVGGYLRVDVVALENEGQRQPEDEERHECYGDEYYEYYFCSR